VIAGVAGAAPSTLSDLAGLGLGANHHVSLNRPFDCWTAPADALTATLKIVPDAGSTVIVFGTELRRI
jgi:hypothetical protein